ncbi:hypothetical protein [Chryseobacterium oryctis]|uniref:Uncharacterized protein n=1 Tax=Chryseobacterium oryctis TaxID=2952618 RepID=A0ABT3HKA0_9FLAO|nr:hypothetical protein [Chryseobacterium oryctis]MCW3160218.1 hypothetical protein [Chryseobacterium oryctis]
MKTLICSILLLSTTTCVAQIGIGTTTPKGTLDVEGNTLVDGSMKINNITDAPINSNLLLVRSEDSTPKGELKLLDINLRNVAPVNKYKVIVSNVDSHQIVDLSTNLPTSKYVVAITDAVFLGASTTSTLVLSSPSKRLYGTFSTEVKTINRTIGGVVTPVYAVNMAFKGANSVALNNNPTKGRWEFSLVVYERSLVKDWGTISGKVTSPTYSSTSTSTPQALQ